MGRNFLVALGILSVVFPLTKAVAIPESEALKKLQVVPVFVITDSNGVPLPIPRGKELVLPLYLESSKANEQLAALNRSNPSIKARVVALPLNVMNEKVEKLRGDLKDKRLRLVAPIVGSDRDRRQAEAILRDQGLSARQISEGLNTPVFFTKPFLTINTPSGPRGVFFFQYESLVDALAKLPTSQRQALKPQVADVSAVLREIIKEPRDNFTIFPTPDYFVLAKNNNLNPTPPAETLGTSVQQPLDSNPISSFERPPSAPDESQKRPKNVAEIAQSITVRIDGPGPSGSGTMVKKIGKTLYIATAWHVLSNVAKGESVQILFSDGSSINVPYSGFERVGDTDLAFMRVDLVSTKTSLVEPVLAEPSQGGQITVSGWSLATRDNPILYRHLPGTVVSVNPVPSIDGYSILYTTLSPTIPGMSGGPVLNDSGQLVGIHGRAERLPSSNVEGVKDIATTNGQAIPIQLLMQKI
jgi:S1-C subfamily serine protease